MSRNRLATSLFSVVVTLALVGGAAIPTSSKHEQPPPPALCELYPIALDAKSLVGVAPGQVLPDILNGTQPGNFGWLTWDGGLSLPTLGRSLTPPGDSGRYVNPDNPTDTEISIGDRVRSRPGAVNAYAVRKGLDLLKTLDSALVPIWDETHGNGSKATYRVSGFARVELLEYRINGNARITVRFLGLGECSPDANRPPVVVDLAATTPEDTPKELTLSGSDPDGDPLGYSIVSGPGHGTLGPLVGDRVTYSPARDYNGPDSFTFKANDGTHDSNVATFRLTVTPVNDAPVCRDIALVTPFETPIETDPDCSDVDGDPLTYAIAAQGTKGTASVVSGRLRYVPNAGQTGVDAYKYRASDGTLTSNDATVTVTIQEHVNRPPIARDDELELEEDASRSVDVLANDSDPDGDPLSFVSWTQAQHGLVSCLPSGTCTYAPGADFAGEDSFTYRIEDGQGGSDEATVRLTVTPVNDTPVAEDAEVETAEDTARNITLAAEDADGDTLAFSVLSGPSHGSLTGVAGGTPTYTPDPNYFGPDEFTFRASDGHDTSQAATVAITVTEVNDQPAPEPDSFAVGVAEATEIPVSVVIWNDRPGPVNELGQSLEITAVAATADTHGTVTLAAGEIIYTPDPGFAGPASVRYTVCDQGTTDGQPDPLCADDGVLSLDVTAADRAPTADPQVLGTAEDVELPITLTGSDPDGDTITYAIVDQPEHGALLGAPPVLTYRPHGDYNGPDAFTFATSDGRARSEVATVSIDVSEVNDPPVLGPDAFTLGGAGELPPVPPRPACPQPCGVIYGDPHADTFDKAHYPFQAVGEFIGAHSTTDDFELQVRTAPVKNSRVVSIATAVAMRVGGHRVALYRTLTGYDARIDGVLTPITPHPRTLPGGGTIGTYGSDNEVVVVWPDGAVAFVAAVGIWPEYYRFTVKLGLPAARLTHMVGLLGDADGVKEDDLVTRDGHQLPYPPPFSELHPRYADSWRISQVESLFDYGPGETTETFTDRTFPDAPATPESLPPGVRAAAAAQCGAFGIVVPEVLAACTVDVGITGDPEFATSSAEAQETVHGIPNNTGVTTLGEPTAVTIATPGEQAVRAFSAAAGQKVTLLVSGNSIPSVTLTIRDPDGLFVANLTVSTASGFRDVVTLPDAGTYTITVDPANQNTGSLTFSIGAVPENTGTTAIGVPTTVVIGTVGENAVRSFAGTAGQLLTLSVSGNTIPGVTLTVRRPDTNFVANLFLSGSSSFRDVFTLPVTGTYTITVDPDVQNTGALLFALNPVAENTGTTAIGTPTTVVTTTVGENPVRSFAATAGQLVTLSVSGNTFSGGVTLTVRRPDTNFVANLFLSGSSSFRDVFTLPVTGTYTITIDPDGQATGTLTFALNPVAENTGTTAIGSPTTVTTTTVGENPVRSFPATAGQLLTLSVSGNTFSGGVTLTVRRPDTNFVANLFLSGSSSFRDVFTLPVTGTYTITIDPDGQATGTLTFALNPVAENTGTTAIGTPTTVTTTTVGENPIRSFPATAGQLLTLSVSGNTFSGGVTLTVRRPDTNFVANLFLSGSSSFRDVFTLPVTGTYTITIDPDGQATGTLTFALNPVAQNTGTTAIGTPTTVTTTTVGENPVRSFPATAGQRVTLAVSGNTFGGVTLTVRQPNTNFVGSLFVSGPTGFKDAMTLPVTGTYTITVDPEGQSIGSLTFTLALAPGAAALRTAAPEPVVETPLAAADDPPVLTLTVADVLANDRPGPANESDQELTVTSVRTTSASHGTAVLTGDQITYTPDAGYSGPATFFYTACDDGTTNGQFDPRCSEGSVSVTIQANHPPTAEPRQLTTAEDAPVAVVLAGQDADGDPLGFRITDSPDHGTLSGTAPNLTYTPAPDFHGTDSFRYAANDGEDESAPVTVGITVTDVNDAPSGQPDSITGGVGQPASVVAATLAGNDNPGPFDERLQTLRVTEVSETADTHGTVTFSSGTITYEPDPGFTGTAKVLYTVCDNGTTAGQPDPKCGEGVLSIVANLAPSATAQSVSTVRNTQLTITLTGTDPEDDGLSFAVASQPAHGTLAGTAPTLVFTPDSGFSGDDEFTFTVADTFNTSAPATVSIDVAETPPPSVRPDAVATTVNTSVLVDVLANDTAAAGSLDPTTLAVAVAPTNGTAVVEGTSIRYTPAPGVAPSDRFTYRVCDTFGVCGQADVTVSSVVPNRPPVAVADSYEVDQEATLDVAPPGLLANDTDPDPGDRLQARLGTGVGAGNLLLRSDGSFRYTPSVGFAGLDSFTYFVVDREGLTSSPVTVKIDVIPPGPLAVDDSYATTKDNPLTVMPSGVLANDRDVHTTDVLTARIDRRPFRGDVDLNPDGSFVYTPEPGFVGADTFRYVTVNVPGVPSAPAFVTISVGAPACTLLPTVSGVTPADGAEVNGPVAVTADVDPPAGETVAEWKVTARHQDGGTPVVLASGTGAPPALLATFDPTTVVNGPYQILVAAKSSGGCTTTATSNVFVSGEMKLGDYTTTYRDMETTIAGYPVQVLRTYDTKDKRHGDFGIGWRVELAGPRATPNNRLGRSGWSTEPFGFPFTRFRFKTTVPHFVTVTSPGGRVEVFDLVPAPSGPLLSLTTPEFVARPGTGTTSKLEDADPPTLSMAGDSLASFFGGTIYDPSLFRLTTKDGDVLIIDRFSGLQSVTDRNGNVLNYSADGVRSPSTGRQLAFERDGAGRITQILGPSGKQTQYRYSAAGDLERFIAANGAEDRFSYGGSHRLLAVDGPASTRLYTLTYGADGRVTSFTDGTGNTVNLSSEVGDRTEILTSPSGRLTELTTYGADGNVASEEEVFSAHSRVTRYEYDAEGRRTRVISPLGRTESFTYDAAGNVTSHTSPKNEKWLFAYNTLNQPTSVVAPDGSLFESRSYDAKGNLTSAAFSNGRTASFTYDSRGLPLTLTDDFGTTTYAYDANQQLTTQTDALARVTRNSYDASGRLSSKENPAGERTDFVWDALDKVVEMTLPNGAKRASSFDAFGQLTAHTDTAGRTTRYRYDNGGRLMALVDRANRTTTYSYDEDGNLVEVAYPDGDVATSAWDPVGRLVSVSDSDTIVELTYNDADDLISERTRGNNGVALPNVMLSYATDPNGQTTNVTGPGGIVDYQYDSRSRLTSVRDPAGQTFALAYDDTDRLVGLSRPNGVADVLTYRDDVLSARNALQGANVVNRAAYGFDAFGRRTSLTDLDGSHAFTHDLADRLTAAVHPPASGLAAESFAFDKVGNRTSWVGSPSDTVDYDAGMQLLSDGTFDYTYDAEGRLTERRNRATGGVTRYTWNAAGQLTSVTAPGGATSTYRYDAFARRLEANDNGVVRRFAYSGWNLHNEFDGTNALRATYVTGNELNGVFEVVRDGDRYFPLFDGVGSVTALTDDTGAVVGRTRYNAFGVPQSSGVTDHGFTYTGHQYDSATGLFYARARYYDPTIGRFLSQDPEPATNPYPYAYNAPFDFTDPTGRNALTEYLLDKWIRFKFWILGTSKAIEEAKKRNLDRAAAAELERLQANMVQVVRTFEVHINDRWRPGGGAG